ncbi:MAG: hypothetical protein HDR44_04150 [Allobaculum sp.]|nr:hypothetical protein [Allobaculum sp.]
MPIHFQKMIKDSFVYTLGFGLIAALLIALFWPNETKILALGGLIWGMAIALIGFVMICQWASQLDLQAKQEKTKGVLGYTGRYLFYALMLFLGAWWHLSVLCMLGGIMIQKLSVFVYALKENAMEKKASQDASNSSIVSDFPLLDDKKSKNDFSLNSLPTSELEKKEDSPSSNSIS